MTKSIGNPAALEALGENLARARGKRTQGEIAKACGIDISTVSDLENGRRNPSYTTLLSLAAALGVELPDLLRGEGTPLEARIVALEKALLSRRPPRPAKPAAKKKTPRR